MKKTAILLMAVISLCSFGGTPLKAYAEAPAAINTDAYVEENIFFTDFDSYKIGSDATVDTPFTGSLNDENYGLIAPNSKDETVKKNMQAATNIGNVSGTCMVFKKESDNENIQMLLNGDKGVTGKVLISFDFYTSQSWGRTQIITEDSSSVIAGKVIQLVETTNTETTITLNKWNNIALYIDTEAGKYSIFCNGFKVGETNTTSQTPLKYFKLQVLDHCIDRYIDNLNIRKVSAEPNQNIYFSDFDSYRVSLGGTVKDSMKDKNLSSWYGTEPSYVAGANEGTQISGTVKDEAAYGTSLRFASGDWRNVTTVLPVSYNAPMVVSFDFNMAVQGTMKILGDDWSNYGAIFNGFNLTIGDDATKKENAIKENAWAHIDIYVDNQNKQFVIYIDGRQMGGVNSFVGKQTALTKVQFQKVSGGVMFIDNLSVKYADTKLYWQEEADDQTGSKVSVVYDKGDENARAYAAEFDAEGRLLSIAIEAETESGSTSGKLTLDKHTGSRYKAFIWHADYSPVREAVEKQF